MKILGIETSCDETAAAIIEVNPPSRKASEGTVKVLSNVISSQVKLHAKYGGVVPNLAAREHVKNIKHVFEHTLREAKIKNFGKEIDLIAVTRGPGLAPSLLVGIAFAKTLAWKYGKPLVGVNHLEGHIYSNWLNPDFKPRAVKYPILNLIVSGGHTELVLMKGSGEYELIGETLDDAAGEAFDKVARLLGLGYPGGPLISKLAEKGDPNTYPLPSPMIKSKNLNFSYSGLKTAALYLTRDLEKDLKSQNLNLKIKQDVAASFQKAAIDVLIKKTEKAIMQYQVDAIMLSGGVSANTTLRARFKGLAEEEKLRYSRSPLEYTGDNAAMIAVAAYFNWTCEVNTSSTSQVLQKFNWESVEMDANLGF